MLEQFWDIHVATDPQSLMTAINAANSDGLPVYIQPGTYDLGSQKINITRDGFTLMGAGAKNTKLVFSRSYTPTGQTDIPCGIAVGIEQEQIKDVRLADFTVELASELNLPGSPSAVERQGGIYLRDCHGAVIERVNADGWNWNDPPFPGYGFQAYNSRIYQNKPAGGVVFHQCGGQECFYGIWLAGVQPMQRCSILNASFSAPGYPIGNSNGYGVYIQQAKGTLVAGGQYNGYQYGIYVAPPALLGNETQLSQIFGVGFDKVSRGVSIGDPTSQYYPPETQVFGVVSDSDLGQIVDAGIDSLVVSRIVDAPYPNRSLILSQAGKSQFPGRIDNPAKVDVRGTLDAAVLQAAGAGIRTHKAEEDLLQNDVLNDVFGTGLPPGFIGIFKTLTTLQTHMVIRSDYSASVTWYHYLLTGPLA
jgi:hypothetical protein